MKRSKLLFLGVILVIGKFLQFAKYVLKKN